MEAVLFLLLCCITSASSQVKPKCYIGSNKIKLVLEQCEDPFTACQVYKKVWSCGFSPPASMLNATCDGDTKCWCTTDECNKPYILAKGFYCYDGGRRNKDNLRRQTACKACWVGDNAWQCRQSCDGKEKNVQEKCDGDPLYPSNYSCCCKSNLCNKPGNYPQDNDAAEGQGPTQGLPTVLPQATTLLAGVLAFLAKATF